MVPLPLRVPRLLVSLLSLAVSLRGAEPDLVTLHEIPLTVGSRSLHLNLAVFDEGRCTLRLVDNAAPNGAPRFERLEQAVASLDGLAGCNGGFFERRPFAPFGGLTIAGREVAPVEPKSWMQGVIALRDDASRLERAATFAPPAGTPTFMQTGPWLVTEGKIAPALETTRSATRTFIAHDGHGLWAIGAASICTLQELGTALRAPEVSARFDVTAALNLDGGPSSGLLVRRAAGTFYQREGWPVRTYLVVVPRSPAARSD